MKPESWVSRVKGRSNLCPIHVVGFVLILKFDNRFGIKLGDSLHVNHTVDFVTKYMINDIV